MAAVPVVQYLDLGPDGPRLVSRECTACGARFFDRRPACAQCGRRDFADAAHPRTGTVEAFTIVHRAAPGVPTPFVSAVVRLSDGMPVKANVIGCPADAEHVHTGMAVQLETFAVGTDAQGTEAVAFGFSPVATAAG
jgi:uncharacterized OB-fold protein